MVNRQDLIDIGFKELPYYTIGNNLIYDLGRNRQLSISCLSTPNEMVFISELDDAIRISDLICLRNYDYDGYIELVEIKQLINLLKNRK